MGRTEKRLISQAPSIARAGIAALLLASAIHLTVMAQSPGINVGVLPVVQPGNGLSTADAALRGDLYLQRQLEPTIAVSTRNPDHVVAFFNDYRAVDIPHDIGLGEVGNVARGNVFKQFLAKLFRRPTQPPPLPTRAAAAEAWVGMSRSSDGGLTWTGSFVPGAPFDNSPASLASPLKGLDAASDPVAFSAPCGYVHVVMMGFTRGGSSKMVVVTYQDENENEGGETFFYKGTTVVETANNATNGPFVDKPAIVVDADRGGSTDSCAHNVYVTYTTFVGQNSSKVTFAKSFAQTSGDALVLSPFSLIKVNQTWNDSQGTALAVDGRPGLPTAGGGPGTIYVVWRHFGNPHTMLISRSTDFGASFTQGQQLSAAPIEAFDQPTLTTTLYSPAEIAFRSNAFPTMAVTNNGNVFVAWQERINLTTGLPSASGSPRIVLMRSTNGGTTWTGPDGAAGQQRAVDFGDRDADPALWPAPGLGFLPQSRASGPQVMPKLTFGGGRLFLSYYESRGVLGPNDTISTTDTTPPAPGFISGIDRVMDLRGALLDPATGALLNGTATTQVSRYPVRADLGILGPGHVEQLGDIEAVNAPCSPDAGPGLPACVRRVNRVGGPTSSAGTAPFIGDYIDATPSVTFVPNGAGGWKWALDAADVPHRSFRSIWTDLRNQVPPLLGVADYPNYSPPGSGGSCINPGSRNADVFTSLVNADLIVTAPTTFTKLGSVQHAYPIFVQNVTSTNRYFRFTIVQGAAFASFDQHSNLPEADVIQNGIFAFSSYSVVVYVEPSATGTVKVNVEELTCAGPVCNPAPGGLSGTATINLDPTNTVAVTFETHNPLVPNPLVPNPLVPNPLVPNPLVPNPLVPNPLVPNPLVPNPLVPNITASNSTLQDPNTTVYNVTYGVTTVTNEGNTTTVFTPDVKIDNPDQYNGQYVFQLVVYKTSATGAADNCNTSTVPGFQILASVPMTSAMLNPLVPNPLVPNPLVPNPLVPNPLVPNPLVPNATFTVAPSDAGPTEQNSHDGTAHAPRGPDQVHIALFAYQITQTPSAVFNPNPPGGPNPGDPPSIEVFSFSCNSDGTCPSDASAPDLVVVDGTPIASPNTLMPGDTATVSFTLKNERPLDANHPLRNAANSEDGDFTHRVFLSADTVLDGTDVDLGVVATSPVTAGPFLAQGTETFLNKTTPNPIPANTAGGPRFLLLFVDDGREVSEVDETNNVVAIPVRINTGPVALPDSLTVEASGPGGSVSVLANDSDPDGDALTVTGVTNPLHGSASHSAANVTYVPASGYIGPDSFTYTISDGYGGTATSTVTVSVVDTTGPVLSLPANITVTATSVAGAVVSYTASATDTVGPSSVPVTCSPPSGSLFVIGTTTVNCSATDAQGNTSTGSFQVIVSTPAPPSVIVVATPNTLLWSPNKTMTPVTVSGTATGMGVTVTYAVQDEYKKIQPSGTVTVGAGGQFSFVVSLEAYRNGNDSDGRLYTITVTSTDAFGRTTSATATVRVPHNQ